MGTILPHRKAQNRQAARVDKNDPIALPCGDGDYSSPSQSPKSTSDEGGKKRSNRFSLRGWGLFFPTAKAKNRQAARVAKNDPLACPCGGRAIRSVPAAKSEHLPIKISRKLLRPVGAGFSGEQPAGRRPGGAAAAANEVRRPVFGGRPAARIPVAAGTFPPSRANLCKTITISFYRKGGLAP